MRWLCCFFHYKSHLIHDSFKISVQYLLLDIYHLKSFSTSLYSLIPFLLLVMLKRSKGYNQDQWDLNKMLISVMMKTLAALSKGSSCYPLGVLHSHAESTPQYSSSDLSVKNPAVLLTVALGKKRHQSRDCQQAAYWAPHRWQQHHCIPPTYVSDSLGSLKALQHTLNCVFCSFFHHPFLKKITTCIVRSFSPINVLF